MAAAHFSPGDISQPLAAACTRSCLPTSSPCPAESLGTACCRARRRGAVAEAEPLAPRESGCLQRALCVSLILGSLSSFASAPPLPALFKSNTSAPRQRPPNCPKERSGPWRGNAGRAPWPQECGPLPLRCCRGCTRVTAPLPPAALPLCQISRRPHPHGLRPAHLCAQVQLRLQHLGIAESKRQNGEAPSCQRAGG
jgi:hypothetical protein